MAKVGFLLTVVLFFVIELTFAAYSPAPAPAPFLGADSSPQLALTTVSGSPYSSPSISPVLASSPPAPMAPSPSDLSPGNSPASSPAPSPYDASDIMHGNINAEGSEENAGGEGGMNSGKKAGVVISVVVAACLVGFGGLIYKKRQENIRRAQYAYAARREIL